MATSNAAPNATTTELAIAATGPSCIPGPCLNRRSPTPHLTRDEYVRLLACIDGMGVATLDALSRALPDVQQPVSAVFDLCDAGVLNVDWESAFDGDMHVWRIDR